MLLTQRAVGGSALIFFMVLVVTGACVLTNLVIASILAAFTDALAEIEEAKAKANEDEIAAFNEGSLFFCSLVTEQRFVVDF